MPDPNDSELNEQASQEPETQSQEPSPPSEQAAGATATQTTAPERYDASWGGVVGGRTHAEVAQMANQMATGLQQMAAQRQQQSYIPAKPDANLAMTDPEKYQADLTAHLQAVNVATINQAAMPIVQQNASTVRKLSAMDPKNKEAFERWGHEIDNYVGSIPLHQRTPELYDKAVKIVRGDHVDEIAQERANKLAASNPGTASSSGRDNFRVSDRGGEEEGVWKTLSKSALGKRMLDQYGKTRIKQNAEAMGNTIEEYAEMVGGNTTVFDPNKPGDWSNDLFNERGKRRGK